MDVERRLRGDAAPIPFPPKTGVLYPSASALPIEDIAVDERPTHLIAIDGTWHQARTLYRDMRWLHQFPHYALNPAEPSRYRIRREPKASFVSTLEAVLYSLHILEPELVGGPELLRCFDAMIDEQIRCAQEATLHHSRRRKRALEHRRKPRALAENFSQLVVVYTETVADAQGKRELVYFAAERLGTGEVFERHVIPRCKPLSSHSAAGPHKPSAVSFASFQRDWEHFSRSNDVFGAWSREALTWLPYDQRLPSGRTVSLKAAYRTLRGGRGSLDEIAVHERLPSEPGTLLGRGGRRLAHAKALAWLMHDC